MSYLPPWPKATVTVPDTLEFFGEDTVLYTEITAVLPDGVRYIRRRRGWDAITEEKAVAEGYGRQFRVPVIDPDGWIDQDDRPAAAWSYVVKVRATAEGRSPVSWSATLSPTSASPVTLDLTAGTLTGVAAGTGTPTVDPATGGLVLSGGESSGSVDLTGYATQTYVDEQVSDAAPPVASIPFVVKWTGTAWPYATLAEAVAAGLDTTQTVWFIGNTGGSMPTWAREGDVWTEG